MHVVASLVTTIARINARCRSFLWLYGLGLPNAVSWTLLTIRIVWIQKKLNPTMLIINGILLLFVYLSMHGVSTEAKNSSHSHFLQEESMKIQPLSPQGNKIIDHKIGYHNTLYYQQHYVVQFLIIIALWVFSASNLTKISPSNHLANWISSIWQLNSVGFIITPLCNSSLG